MDFFRPLAGDAPVQRLRLRPGHQVGGEEAAAHEDRPRILRRPGPYLFSTLKQVDLCLITYFKC
jgi:hypothetical protein